MLIIPHTHYFAGII